MWPIRQEDIRAAERELGVCFPGSYAAGMQRANGGEVTFGGLVWTLCPFMDRSERKKLLRTSNDVVRETSRFRGIGWFPPTGVVIATVDSHCLFLSRRNEHPELEDTVLAWFLDADGYEIAFESTADLIATRHTW